MKKCYQISFHTICIDAPHFPQESSYWKPFEICESSECDLNITCKIVDKLPVPEGLQCVSENGVRVYYDGGMIFREKFMGTAPGVLTCYDENDISKSTCFFTPQSFNTMMDSRYMWDSASLAQLLLPRKTVFMHASYIKIGPKALLFSAPCGTGKSTQAELWRKHRGAEIINGDKAAVSLHNGSVYAHGVPFCGTSGICINRSIPLCGIVMLSQSKTNTITRLSAIDAIRKMTENIYLDYLAPDEQRKCVDLIIGILSGVPVYSLACTPDEDAVKALETQLTKEGLI